MKRTGPYDIHMFFFVARAVPDPVERICMHCRRGCPACEATLLSRGGASRVPGPQSLACRHCLQRSPCSPPGRRSGTQASWKAKAEGTQHHYSSCPILVLITVPWIQRSHLGIRSANMIGRGKVGSFEKWHRWWARRCPQPMGSLQDQQRANAVHSHRQTASRAVLG